MKLFSNIKKEIIAFLGVILTLALFVYTQRDINEIRYQDRIDYFSLNNSILNARFEPDSLKFSPWMRGEDSIDLFLDFNVLNTSNYQCELYGVITSINDVLYPYLNDDITNYIVFERYNFIEHYENTNYFYYNEHLTILPHDSLKLHINHQTVFNKNKIYSHHKLHIMFVYKNGLGGFYSTYILSEIFFDTNTNDITIKKTGELIPIQIYSHRNIYKTFSPKDFEMIEKNFYIITRYDPIQFTRMIGGNPYLRRY